MVIIFIWHARDVIAELTKAERELASPPEQ